MEFTFANGIAAQADAHQLRQVLSVFAGDPTLQCLTFYQYENGLVSFCSNDTLPGIISIHWVDMWFEGAGLNTITSLCVTLRSPVQLTRVEQGMGSPLINHVSMTKFVQALHSKWIAS